MNVLNVSIYARCMQLHVKTSKLEKFHCFAVSAANAWMPVPAKPFIMESEEYLREQ